MLMPIGGYENTPLITILPAIQSHAYIAKERCKKPADGLTPDESASINRQTNIDTVLSVSEALSHCTFASTVSTSIYLSGNQIRLE